MKLLSVCLLIAGFKHLLGCWFLEDKFKGIYLWEDDGASRK
jgi:hypothetical protein